MFKSLGISFTALFLSVGTAFAQTATLTINSYGGSMEEAFTKVVVEPFEREYGVEVSVQTMYSGDVLAQMRAQKNNQQFDVVYFSGGQEVNAAEEGLIQPIDPGSLSNIADVYPFAVDGLKNGYGPVVMLGTNGILYNSEKMKDPPAKWADLLNPEVAKDLMLIDMSDSIGLRAFLMINSVSGGTIDNIKPGVAAIKSILEAGAFIVSSTPEVVQNLVQGTAAATTHNQVTGMTLARSGSPIQFVFPEDGIPASAITANIVADRPHIDAATKFIDFQLRPEVQAALAEEAGYSPVNRKSQLSAEMRQFTLGENELSKLVFFDPAEVAARRSEWLEEWNKAISK